MGNKDTIKYIIVLAVLIFGVMLLQQMRKAAVGMDKENEYSEYLQNNPPRCISGFGTKFISEHSVMGGHAEPLHPGFTLTCGCGHDKLFVKGFLWYNDHYKQEYFVCPLTAQCESCKKETGIFDNTKHGYDAEHGFDWGGYEDVKGPETFSCNKCGPTAMIIAVWFENHSDLFLDLDEKCAGRQQDFFSWFTIKGYCPKCKRVLDIADFECA